ncbi:MAG: MFS transporter [Planctomycetota bacterium]
MDATESQGAPAIGTPQTVSAISAEAPSPPSGTSQAFHRQLDPVAIKRSMFFTIMGSTIGMVMFGVVQGTVINFFLEDLSLKDRIPWFTGLLWLSGVGSVVGSWIQERWGHRRALMIVCCGSARLTWLFMGLLPFIWPEKVPNGGLFVWMSVCTVFFYFIHSIGANAWLAWMSDLVPPEHQSRFWSLRQVGTFTSNSAARLGFGWYLEQHRDMRGYAIIFGIASIAGLIDVASYFWVEHREPVRVKARESVLSESLKRLKGSSFQKLCGVYLFWLASNCIMAPTVYYFLRDHVQMGPYSISLCMTISILIGFAILSPFWGRFSNYEGHRRAVIASLILQNVCTVFYWNCGHGTTTLATVASTFEQAGIGGMTLFMFPMLIDYTKGKGAGRAVGMAVFTTLLSFVGFGASIVADRRIYAWVAALLNSATHETSYVSTSVPVYLGIMLIAFALRGVALFLAWTLPPCEKQIAAGPGGSMILRRMAEGPMRSAGNILAYASKRMNEDDELEVKDDSNVS